MRIELTKDSLLITVCEDWMIFFVKVTNCLEQYRLRHSYI